MGKEGELYSPSVSISLHYVAVVACLSSQTVVTLYPLFTSVNRKARLVSKRIPRGWNHHVHVSVVMAAWDALLPLAVITFFVKSIWSLPFFISVGLCLCVIGEADQVQPKERLSTSPSLDISRKRSPNAMDGSGDVESLVPAKSKKCKSVSARSKRTPRRPPAFSPKLLRSVIKKRGLKLDGYGRMVQQGPK